MAIRDSAADRSLRAARRTKIFARYGEHPSYSLSERTIRYTFRLLAYMTVGITISIVAMLFTDALHFFRLTGVWEFFTGTVWEPFGEPKQLGVLPLLLGTLQVALGSMAIALPLGLATAIYLTQFSPHRLREILAPLIEILGGIPTVVYGYFALTAVTPFLKSIFPEIEVFNALSASIVVGIAILPMISSISIDSLDAVPLSIRNGAHALGLRKFHLITRIILPASISGVLAASLLAFARAIGETMAVTLAAGATPNTSLSYLEGIQTMTAFIVQISLGDTPAGTIEYYTIYAIGLTLFFVTLGFNLIATRVVLRFRETYT